MHATLNRVRSTAPNNGTDAEYKARVEGLIDDAMRHYEESQKWARIANEHSY